MSKVLIGQYLNELAQLRQVSGSSRESVVREAFKDLLKGYARSHDLVFVPEFEVESPAKERRYVDGALLHALRLPFGYWEAKDEKDDLDAEIEIKFKRGYPKDNIIFEDSTQAVLIQNGVQVTRCKVDDVNALERLLGLFFGYQRPEIAQFRKAVEQFTTDLPQVLAELRRRIADAHDTNAAFRKAAEKFLDHARKAINPGLTEEDVREILIQHILTDEIFDTVFPGQIFHKDNNVARELHKLEDTFFTGNTKHQTLKSLDIYYAAIRSAAARIGSHHEKQSFLKVVYENFYKVYNPKAADRLGVVYTPNEIVRFMIESADWLCEHYFNRNLVDRDVEILDPAVGTGTFITELIEHFRGQPAKLKHKYKEELHANEVGLLPYYVANLNIEATYAAVMGEYEEFEGLCLVDTLDNTAGLGKQTGDQIADLFGMGDENVARIKRQNRRKISVIIGNPPYNANQKNENDNNKNREYPEIDRRIKNTYVKASSAQKTKNYDMYSRFFRWASDRLHDDGILAFITNSSFVQKKNFDGFRKVVGRDFSYGYVIDMGGEMRDGDSHGNVFGITLGVAISFWVKKRNFANSLCDIRYYSMPRVLSAEDRLMKLVGGFKKIDFKPVSDVPGGSWIAIDDDGFSSGIPLAIKRDKRKQPHSIFYVSSLGLSTNRDEWIYDFSKFNILNKHKYLVDRFENSKISGVFDQTIKWSRNLKRRLAQGRCDQGVEIDIVQHRPYVRKFFLNSKLFIDERGRMDDFYSSKFDSRTIVFSDPTSQKESIVISTDVFFDLHLVGAGAGAVGFPVQNSGNENVTDWALKQFRNHYKVPSSKISSMDARAGSSAGEKERAVTKEAIFYYVYAVLHDPVYRDKYALNLKREFPRIPLYGKNPADFWCWSKWGKALMDLHVGYETVEPWPLRRIERIPAESAGITIDVAEESIAASTVPAKDINKNFATIEAPKVMLKADKAAGIITLDGDTTLTGIPPEAWMYKLGNRSALEWILDQYKESKPRDPTIREKFNNYRFADHKEHVIDLLMRVTRVSIETQAITDAMRTTPRDASED